MKSRPTTLHYCMPELAGHRTAEMMIWGSIFVTNRLADVDCQDCLDEWNRTATRRARLLALWRRVVNS